jgi:hypothetical protein
LASKFGSFESLKVRVKCGLISFAAQMRWTLARETPTRRAIELVEDFDIVDDTPVRSTKVEETTPLNF